MSQETARPVADVARTVALAYQAEDWPAALTAIAEGEQLSPDAVLPGEATWEKLRTVVEAKLRVAEREEEESLAGGQESALAEPETDEEPETEATGPVSAEVMPQPVGRHPVLIKHTVQHGTVLLNTTSELGKRVSAIMGANGLKWRFSFGLDLGEAKKRPGWYIRGSRSGGADMRRIWEAIDALNDDGAFMATCIVDSTDADGETLPPNLTQAETDRRARERVAALNTLAWHLGSTEDGLPCHHCHTPGLRLETAKVVESVAWKPIVVCESCVGPREILPLPQESTAPVLPAEDEPIDDDEPIAEPEPAPATAKRQPRQRQAQPDSDMGGIDLSLLFAMAKLGDAASQEEIFRRALTAIAPTGGRKSAAVPVSAPPAMVVAESGPIELVFALDAEAHVRATASDVRRNLYTQVTAPNRKLGVEITVFADRKERTLKATISCTGAPTAARKKIMDTAAKAALRTRGVAANVPLSA